MRDIDIVLSGSTAADIADAEAAHGAPGARYDEARRVVGNLDAMAMQMWITPIQLAAELLPLTVPFPAARREARHVTPPRAAQQLFFLYSHEEHRRPHVHVRAGEYRATLDVDTGRVLAGGLPPPMLRQARRWVRWRRQALLEAFAAALRHDDPSQVAAQFKEAIGEG